MKTITMLNEKGGIGKTTTATTLAAGLAYYGYRTLVVDMDSQGHVAARFGVKPIDGVYYAMTNQVAERQDWNDLLRGLSPEIYGRDHKDSLLWILSGYRLTRQFSQNFNVGQIVPLLRQWAGFFDFVVFDTSPQIGAIHSALMVVSDYLILPTECTRLSVTGLNSTIAHHHQLREKNGEKLTQAGMKVAEILGILPTRFNGKKSVHYQNLGFLDGRYGENIHSFEPIRLLTDWEKAEAKLLPVFVYKPRGEAAGEAMGFINDVLKRMGVGVHEQLA